MTCCQVDGKRASRRCEWSCRRLLAGNGQVFRLGERLNSEIANLGQLGEAFSASPALGFFEFSSEVLNVLA